MNPRLRAAPVLLFSGLALIHFFFVARVAINFPFWDEWEMILGLERARDNSLWTWILSPHNEHLILVTKLQVWLSYLFNGWDVRQITILNFALFLLIPLGFFAFLSRREGRPAYWIFWFLIFVLSPINYENHGWSHQSCFHFSVLLMGISAWLLFGARQTWTAMAIGALTGGLAIFSLASSVTGSLALLIVFSVRKFVAARSRPTVSEARREVLQLALVLGLYLCAVASFWRIVMPTRGGVSALVLLTWDFWKFYFGTFTFGFGIDGKAIWLGPLILALFASCLWRFRRRLLAGDATLWTLVAWTTIILGMVAGIALGRVGMGVWISRSARYFELVMLLPTLLAALWSQAEVSPVKLQRALIVGWIGLFCAFYNNWNFSIYETTGRARQNGRACVNKLLALNEPDGTCSEAYPNPIGNYLRAARRLDLKFVRP